MVSGPLELFGDGDSAALVEPLERYLRQSYAFTRRREALARPPAIAREHWSAFAELGLLGLPLSEEDGGFGGSLGNVMAVGRVLGGALVLEPYIELVVLAARLLARSGSAALKAAWLPAIVAGERVLGFAHVERGDRGRGQVRSTRLVRDGDGFRLHGAKLLVAAGADADALLVSARLDGALQVVLVDRGTEPSSVRTARGVDGRPIAEVRFDGVFVPAAQLLRFDDASAALDGVMTYGEAVLCAEAVGCLQALLDMTLEHVRTRRQFGQPIGRFQALRHRLVDAYGSVRQADELLAAIVVQDDPSWPAAVRSARGFLSDHALRVSHEAIQMHGGMGLTDELAVSHFHKRLVAIVQSFRDPEPRRRQCAAVAASTSIVPFERALNAPERQFRADVRAFLRQALTEDMRTEVRRQTGTYPEKPLVLEWQRRLNERGWLAPHWPRELGGTGWTPLERFVFEYEAAVAGAPETVPMGLRYVGPVIAQFGTDWQKQYFLPRILSGEHYWAQGFSEPGAGSDLAAITTTAELDGDEWVLNGSKMWTTHAHFANWLFCLARTSRGSRPQEGISFLLVPLGARGVRVDPIPLLAIDHEVNQVFLDGVRIPASHLVGQAGQGWSYAKFLLELERGGLYFCGRARFELGLLRTLVVEAAGHLLEDGAFVDRLAGLEDRVVALESLEFAGALRATRGTGEVAHGSLTKLLGTELQKDITALAAEAAGYAGLELVPARPLGRPGSVPPTACELESVAMPRYLNLRAASVYGGSSEIQREILARQLLELP